MTFGLVSVTAVSRFQSFGEVSVTAETVIALSALAEISLNSKVAMTCSFPVQL